jgi:single-stranded-DNA-specific exonuclease
MSAHTAQCLINRGITDAEAGRRFFSPGLTSLRDPFELPDMEQAVACFRQAIAAEEPILLFGDSDVDGLTATAILYEVLRSLGARVAVRLSNRIEDGYGLSQSAIRQISRTSAKVAVLVDCGTNQPEEISQLAAAGLTTIIIDHHLPLASCATPTALVNPHHAGSVGRELCSAGLAFKVAQALVGPAALPRLAAYLDLAALGTVADYVPLLEESRLIVSAGLSRVVHTCRPGLARLCEATDTRQATTEHLSRGVIPRLNAFGRLGDPTTAWHLLLEASDDRLDAWLAEAEEAHAKTKELHGRVLGEAQEQVNRLHFRDQFVLVVSRPGWPQGLMGPVASQLTARYGRPSIVIAMDDGVGTGSGRSIPRFNLLEALKSCQELLVRFGGHAQACGLTLAGKNLEAFRLLVNQEAERSLGRRGLMKTRAVDLELPLEAMTPEWVEELEAFAPFGPGNPRPSMLVRGVTIQTISARTGWLSDGSRRLAAKGSFASLMPVEGAAYDVAVSPAVLERELVLTVSDAKASTALSGRGRT